MVCFPKSKPQKGVRSMRSGTLQVQTLGGFAIRWEEKAVMGGARSRKLCLLLAFLIQERDRIVPTGELARLLGEEKAPDAAALNALKAILHRARNLLDSLWEGAGRTLILSREGGCQWNPEIPLTLDRTEFVRLCQAGEAAQSEEERLARYLEAVALYQGDFLPALTGYPWAAQEAGCLHRLYLHTVLETLSLLSRQGRWQESAQVSTSAFALDSRQEELCRAHMEALLHLDRLPEAAQAYEKFQDQLLIHLGVMPSDQLRELYRQTQRSSDPRAISPANLLERLLEEPQAGALLCEYDFFRTVCHSMARMAERTGGALHVVLISLTGAEEARLAQHSLDRAMDHLQEVIRSQLRRGDVFTRCSASQFVLLLPMADYQNSQRIAARITRSFSRQYPHSPALLQSAVQPLLSSPPKSEA